MERADAEAQINAARHDPDALYDLCERLSGIKEPWAGPLRFRAMHLRVKARRGEATAVAEANPKAASAPDWLASYGLSHPDGRPLYRYRIERHHFLAVQSELKSRQQYLKSSAHRRDAALFVIWAAEWFRRCYRGGVQRWNDLGCEIGLELDHAAWRRLADNGLRFWKIEPLRIGGVHLRLAALACQGGFPIAALEGEDAGWAGRYLERLTGILLAEPDPTLETADAHAQALEELIPLTWRHEGMRTVCAELTLQIVRLRREAEEGGAIAGALVSAWLDEHRPNWRERLPLVVDDGGALVNGLMRATPLKGGSGSIRATRLLVLEGKNWRERARLDLSGVIRDVEGRTVLGSLAADWSRLRLYPSGEFARHVSGELAVVEPDEHGDWRARPTSSRTDFDLPVSIPIELELRGEGKRVCAPFFIPNGARVAGGLRTCVGVVGPDGSPVELSIVGTGSGAFRAELLYLDTPVGWLVERQGEESHCHLLEERRDESRVLWEIAGAVLVRSEEGDRYLIRSGQTNERRDALSLIGDAPTGCRSSDNITPLFAGAPRLELRDGGRARAPESSEGWWRSRGTREWLACRNTNPAGHCEFAWLDATTGHVRDRTEAIVLPKQFSISRALSRDHVDVSIEGWDGARDMESGQKTSSGNWRFSRRGASRSTAIARLFAAHNDPILLELFVPHQAWISSWSSGPLPAGSTLGLGTINQFVARSEHPCQLMADLIDSSGRKVDQGQACWWVEGELPLSAIRDDLASLLRPLGDLRTRIQLNFHDGNEDYWYVEEFEVKLQDSGGGLVSSRAIVDEAVRVVGRPLHDPVHERDDFGAYGLTQSVNHRPIDLPPLRGEWLIYLRSNERVISEPRRVEGSPLAVLPHTPLARAMALTSWAARDAALDQLCEDLIADPSSSVSLEALRIIVRLAASLDGLRPSTFDILSKVARHLPLGPLLLFSAAEGDVEALMRLATGLPFAWVLIAKRHWESASKTKAEELFALMPDRFEDIALAIGSRRRAIQAADETLATLLDLPTPKIGLVDAAHKFLLRSGDQALSEIANPFRPELELFLPQWRFRLDYWRALDAPIAAALAASERVSLSIPQVYCIKDVARHHPRYFREAFSAALLEFDLG